MGIPAHVAESNCALVRGREEQLEANDRSVTHVNVIRLCDMASLPGKDEAQKTLRVKGMKAEISQGG